MEVKMILTDHIQHKSFSGRSNLDLYQADNMIMMAQIPDNYFELAIVDPPYGIGTCIQSLSNLHKKKMDWNNDIPSTNYFNELHRISKNQIIWGVNYYNLNLHPGRIIHDKTPILGNNLKELSDADLASHSFNNSIKMFRFEWRGNVQGSTINWKNIGINRRIHPTQKPVELYEWLLHNYAKQGDKILDTHSGSLSIAIACWNMGFDLTAFELDADYYNDSIKRVERHVAQKQLF